MSFHFQSGQGALFVQRSGPNTRPAYLGCHQLGDTDEPQGDIELIYCPSPAAPNRFVVVGSIQGAPGAITTSITTDVTDELDELERANCPFTLYANMFKAGRRDSFMNFDRTFVFTNARITSRGLSGLAARTPEDQGRSEQTFDISAETLLRLMEPTLARQTISETSSINDISFCNDETCRTDEVAAQETCQVGYAVTDAAAGSPSATANVLKTLNGGSWAVTDTDPFAAGEDIIGVECFEFGRDTVRVIVARGTTDGSNPAEIAYSDDGGATWTAVDVGEINGEYAPTRHSLFALDQQNIWVGTNGGYIYYSDDGGLTWTAVQAAGIHSGNWNALRFISEEVGWAVGDANVLAKTLDGGVSWTSVTGPTEQAAENAVVVEVLDRNRVWVGYDNGKMYYTLDGGTNWTQRSFFGSGVGQVRDIRFFDDNLGYLVVDNASPVGRLHWTVDGGYNWAALGAETNAGYNAVHICDQWSAFVVGEAQGGLGYIAKATV